MLPEITAGATVSLLCSVEHSGSHAGLGKINLPPSFPTSTLVQYVCCDSNCAIDDFEVSAFGDYLFTQLLLSNLDKSCYLF